jgi:hypothetical protein
MPGILEKSVILGKHHKAAVYCASNSGGPKAAVFSALQAGK